MLRILLLPAYLLTGLILYRRWGQLKADEALMFLFAYLMGGIYRWYSFPLFGYLLLGWTTVLCHRRLRSHEE